MKNNFLSIYLLIFVLAGSVSAKDWRGIVPLKSTRVDVERLLGVPQKVSPGAAFYNRSAEIVVIYFQTEGCDKDRFGLGWNVPLDTVVGIGVIPKGTHRKEEYLLTTSFTFRDEGSDLTYYLDNAGGLSIETYKNSVTHLDYTPGKNDEHLQCPVLEKCCFHFLPLFDEYQLPSFEDEKARLDNFLIQMDGRLARGVIQIYGASPKERSRMMKLAARAKNYLVKQRGVASERLLIVDGGYLEDTVTRLYIYSIGGLASRIYVSPAKDPVNPVPNKR